LLHPWSSVSARVCAGNADFDELTVKHACPDFGVEIIILCGGFAHSCKATLNREVLIWSFRCLDETEFREFVLKKFKRQRVGPIADHLFKHFLRRPWDRSVWLAVLTVAREQHKFQTAGVQSGKQIQSRSNANSHISLARCEM